MNSKEVFIVDIIFDFGAQCFELKKVENLFAFLEIDGCRDGVWGMGYWQFDPMDIELNASQLLCDAIDKI